MKAYTFSSQAIKHTGFSLVELLMAVTIASVLLSITISNLSPLSQKSRKYDYMTQLHSHLIAARSFAINNADFISICPHINYQCVDSWTNDIMMFVDSNKDITRSQNELVIADLTSPEGGDSLRYSRRGLTFTPSGGIVGFANGSFLYCSENSSLNQPAVRISVANSGRVRLKEDSDKCKQSNQG
ncbi:GspH/FimT family pseudopilin [Pseudoalteromonas sp. SSDWG2]|uniref:GspH/FimT family pseudopilin n=1 Tax=Pseudoalteromonas sp. SSDWG2 TaxID=3139391 RepID=UPI003BAAFA10